MINTIQFCMALASLSLVFPLTETLCETPDSTVRVTVSPSTTPSAHLALLTAMDCARQAGTGDFTVKFFSAEATVLAPDKGHSSARVAVKLDLAVQHARGGAAAEASFQIVEASLAKLGVQTETGVLKYESLRGSLLDLPSETSIPVPLVGTIRGSHRALVEIELPGTAVPSPSHDRVTDSSSREQSPTAYVRAIAANRQVCLGAVAISAQADAKSTGQRRLYTIKPQSSTSQLPTPLGKATGTEKPQFTRQQVANFLRLLETRSRHIHLTSVKLESLENKRVLIESITLSSPLKASK